MLNQSNEERIRHLLATALSLLLCDYLTGVDANKGSAGYRLSSEYTYTKKEEI